MYPQKQYSRPSSQQRNYRTPHEPKLSNELIFGIRAVMEAIHAGKEIETLYIQKGIGGDLVLELKQLLKLNELSYLSVPVEKLNRLTSKNHQGVVAFVSPIDYHRLEQLVPQLYEQGEVPLMLVLDRVTDVRNYGAIARSAACMGVHGIVVPLKGSAQTNPDAIKTSAGALFKIPVCRVNRLEDAVKFLQESGLTVVACSEKAKQPISSIDFTVPTAIIMGSEEDGISTDLIKKADSLVKIPMLGDIASLNVAVSAGVILYEVLRQRMVS